MNDERLKSFTQLVVWQKAHQLVLVIYSLSKKFPKEETFGITNQIRRAVVSIPSNIAEGFSRKNKKEKIQFLYVALGSLTEVQNQLLICRDLSYINNRDFDNLAKLTIEVGKLINSYINSLKTKQLIDNR